MLEYDDDLGGDVWAGHWVITDPEDKRKHYMLARDIERIHQFWKPLPEEHPRVQAWLAMMYASIRSESYLPEKRAERILRFYPAHRVRLDQLYYEPHGRRYRSVWWTVLGAPLKVEEIRENDSPWIKELSLRDD